MSVPHKCPKCDGRRELAPYGNTCPTCKGEGVVWEPSHTAQEAKEQAGTDPMDLTYRG